MPITATCDEQKLSDLVQSRNHSAVPLAVSPWMAMSLLQKSIRRGSEEWALRAAATLIAQAPDKLWRRLAHIAYEDIGLADIDVPLLTNRAVSGKRMRSGLGSEWQVASALVSRMSAAPKCRAADDLLMSAQLHPNYRYERKFFASLSPADLISFVSSGKILHQRTLALWYLAGTDQRSATGLVPRNGNPSDVMSALRAANLSEPVLALAMTGFQRTRSVLPLLMALLSLIEPDCSTVTQDDQIQPDVHARGIPTWAIDLYTREGRHSLKAFGDTTCETARWVQGHIPPSERVAFLGSLVFRVEGQRCRRRWRWKTGDRLRQMVDEGCHGPDAHQLLASMKADLALLNEVRQWQ